MMFRNREHHGVVGGQQPRPDLLLDPGVVLRELAGPPVPVDVGPGVPHVADGDVLAVEGGGGEGGPHPGVLGVGVGGFVDGPGCDHDHVLESSPQRGGGPPRLVAPGGRSRAAGAVISRSRISTAMRLARSPPRCPPMPSATAYRPSLSLHRKLSSLWSRLRPTSVTAHPRVFMSAPCPGRRLLTGCAVGARGGAYPRGGPALDDEVDLDGPGARAHGDQPAGLDALRPQGRLRASAAGLVGSPPPRHLDAQTLASSVWPRITIATSFITTALPAVSWGLPPEAEKPDLLAQLDLVPHQRTISAPGVRAAVVVLEAVQRLGLRWGSWSLLSGMPSLSLSGSGQPSSSSKPSLSSGSFGQLSKSSGMPSPSLSGSGQPSSSSKPSRSSGSSGHLSTLVGDAVAVAVLVGRRAAVVRLLALAVLGGVRAGVVEVGDAVLVVVGLGAAVLVLELVEVLGVVRALVLRVGDAVAVVVGVGAAVVVLEAVAVLGLVGALVVDVRDPVAVAVAEVGIEVHRQEQAQVGASDAAGEAAPPPAVTDHIPLTANRAAASSSTGLASE